jgi:transcriptional regulator with XRE-family HTH domain
MPIDYKIIGSRIRQLRKQAELTQEGFAEKLDISVSFQSRLERGAAKISLEKLVQTAECLNVPVGELITGAKENSDDYLNADIHKIIKDFDAKKMKLLLEIADVIAK